MDSQAYISKITVDYNIRPEVKCGCADMRM